MRGGVQAIRPRPSTPAIGLWIPSAVLHLGFFALAAGLCFLMLPAPLWLAAGIGLAAAATLVPSIVPAWWFLLALSLSQFWREPSATDITFYLLLAGVHLLHLISGLTRLVSWGGRIQLAALVRPFQRFLVVQAAAQTVAVGALFALSSAPGVVPGLSILAALVLGALILVFSRRLRER